MADQSGAAGERIDPSQAEMHPVFAHQFAETEQLGRDRIKAQGR